MTACICSPDRGDSRRDRSLGCGGAFFELGAAFEPGAAFGLDAAFALGAAFEREIFARGAAFACALPLFGLPCCFDLFVFMSAIVAQKNPPNYAMVAKPLYSV